MTSGDFLRAVRSPVALFSAALLLLPSGVSAQSKTRPPAHQTASSQAQDTLKVFVLEGEGAVNFIPDGKGKTVVVEVRDSNDLPLENVDVLFELPTSGPGGFFAAGGSAKTVKTTLQGQAEAPFTINPEPGPFQIKVTATIGDRKGHSTISQSNSLKFVDVKLTKSKHWYTNWKILAAAAATAAVVGIVLGTRGGSSTTATPTVIITPGGPVIGPPR